MSLRQWAALINLFFRVLAQGRLMSQVYRSIVEALGEGHQPDSTAASLYVIAEKGHVIIDALEGGGAGKSPEEQAILNFVADYIAPDGSSLEDQLYYLSETYHVFSVNSPSPGMSALMSVLSDTGEGQVSMGILQGTPIAEDSATGEVANAVAARVVGY